MPSVPGKGSNNKRTPVSKRSGRSSKRDKDGFYFAGLAISRFVTAVFGFFAKLFGFFAKLFGLFAKPFKSKTVLRYTIIAVAVLVLGFGGFGVYRLLTAKNAFEVFLDGESVGTIKETKLTAADIANQVTAKLTKENNCPVEYSEVITTEALHASQKDLVTIDSVISTIGGLVKVKLLAASITIGDVEMYILKSEAEANTIRDNIISGFVDPEKNIIEKTIVEGFIVTPLYVDKSEIISSDEAYEMLTRTSETTVVYSVKSGDSYWSIARQNNITLAELVRLNPGLDINGTLSIGGKLNLSAQKPLLSVRTVERYTFIEVEPKKVEYQNNPNEPTSYSKVITQGANGQREVTEDIVRINGFETERIPVGKLTTQEPVTEIIERGTKQ